MQERKAKKKIVYSRKAKETRLAAGGLVLRFPVEIPSRWGLGGRKEGFDFLFPLDGAPLSFVRWMEKRLGRCEALSAAFILRAPSAQWTFSAEPYFLRSRTGLPGGLQTTPADIGNPLRSHRRCDTMCVLPIGPHSISLWSAPAEMSGL